MKHNTLKKVLSLLLVIGMMASFAGCIPGEEDPTKPSTIETTSPTENTTAPTDGTTLPTDSPDESTSPTEETKAPTTPTEAEAEPPATEAPSTDPPLPPNFRQNLLLKPLWMLWKPYMPSPL